DGTPLKFTVAWDDAPGTPGASMALVNDLDVVAIAPDGTIHHPWTLDPSNPAAAAQRTGRNGVDNIEQIVVDAPQPGEWRVVVSGASVPEGPQGFALSSTEDLLRETFVLGLAAPVPALVPPGEPFEIRLAVDDPMGDLLGGSLELHVR